MMVMTESPYVLQDGERVVSGHDVEIRNDEQIIVPTLEDALNMVNNPYTVYNEHNMQYYGPEELYNNIDYTQPADLSVHNMNGSDYDYQDDPFEEQIKLRENALQNGGPKLAFMNNECTDGVLPKTIGRNSPSGSLTSLDSLDEVPSDCLPGQEKPLQPVPVTGIISKDKGKSTERRRVTFSDSIEFDDGFTGQLVTAEKESCKQYVKQYNSRLATSNAAYNGTKAGVYNTNGGNKATGKVIGTPGNTPVRKVPTNTSASMVVPLSLYSQFSGTDNEGQASYGTNENNTCSSESKLVSKGSANSSYYKSWYPGSFFPSKSYLADDDDDDSVKQDKAIRKSVAYDLIQNVDEEQNVTKYSPKPKDLAKPRDTTSRQSNPGSNVDNSGRINPLGNTAPDVQKEPYNSNEQVKHHIDSSHETRANRMTAKPPHPSTRHKGVVYNSPLHRKRAAVAAKRTAATPLTGNNADLGNIPEGNSGKCVFADFRVIL
ncbi:hypothetical protein QZH41_007418 [Actinostola sp. cb2023]|nr:hypothetical protein QZH41_007418 [Actinostola sp. cb2023]